MKAVRLKFEIVDVPEKLDRDLPEGGITVELQQVCYMSVSLLALAKHPGITFIGDVSKQAEIFLNSFILMGVLDDN